MSADNSDPSIRPPINIRSTSLAVLSVIATVYFLEWAQSFFAPVVLGVLLSYALYPVVTQLNRLHVPRVIGSALVVAALVVAVVFASGALRDQAIDIIDKVPAALKEFNRVARFRPPGESVIDKVEEAAVELSKATESAGLMPESDAGPEGVPAVVVRQDSLNIVDIVLGSSVGGLVMASQLLSVLLLVFFILASGKLYRQKMVRIAGDSLSEKKLTVAILDEINLQLRRFFFVMFVGGVFVGVFTWLAFWWIGLEEAALWGAIAGVASLIPYLGPLLVFAATGIVAFLQFGTLSMVLLVSFTSLVITSIQGNILTPWMTSRASSMNAISVFVSLLFWGWLWGPIGLIVATPIQMIIKSVCDHVENLRPIGELMGR